ncbi:hypothetical protein DNTS_033912, partial [Danionella cerebrum]
TFLWKKRTFELEPDSAAPPEISFEYVQTPALCYIPGDQTEPRGGLGKPARVDLARQEQTKPSWKFWADSLSQREALFHCSERPPSARHGTERITAWLDGFFEDGEEEVDLSQISSSPQSRDVVGVLVARVRGDNGDLLPSAIFEMVELRDFSNADEGAWRELKWWGLAGGGVNTFRGVMDNNILGRKSTPDTPTSDCKYKRSL